MYRKIMDYFIEWKNSPYRKPLILQGARQVGKTYSVLAFGREHYENVAYFNFETDPLLARTFEESIDPGYLIPILSRISGQTIIREKTLIVLDEVQLCERALTSLKYFCENAPEYHIIVAGSLLAYFAGEFTNSYVLAKLKLLTRGRWLWTRTIGSTLVGQMVDTLVFVLVATLFGVFPWSLFLSLSLTNYLFKCGIEVVMTPITYAVVNQLKRFEREDYYDTDTSFNPFRI